jgi:hypothetical protein
MTQLETLKMMRDILLANDFRLRTGNGILGEYYYNQCLHNINNMIRSRIKTPEQLERENARRREARAKKRVQRDDEIWGAIMQYMQEPHTASQLEYLIKQDFLNGKIEKPVSAGELISFFNRHCNDIPGFSCTPPRRERTFQVRV